MKIVTYDCEVFSHDWIVVFKDKETGIFTVVHNDNEALRSCISEDAVYIGFNSKHYDQYIVKGICADLSPQEIKQLNDYIIAGNQGWQYPLLNGFYFSFNNVDIRDDTQQGLSLKAIEGHMGISIQETEVDFNLDRPLTQEELDQTIFYCKHDVDATEKLTEIRKDYLKNKINLGRMAGLTDTKAMAMTNGKLTAAMLKATAQKHDDERQYVYPDNLRREYIPQEVFDFFDRMYDPNISDAEYFKSKLEISVGECPVTIGFGGIHGAIPTYVEEATENRSIRNKDVASYYPHLMTLPLSEGKQYGYCSRNIPSPQLFVDTLESRVRAKKAGDKDTANALKLVLNTTYGTMLNGRNGVAYNDLYDPLMGRSVCITGQLLLLELSIHLTRECPTLKIIQLNTDGIMVSFDNSDEAKWQEITQEWQDRTGFELEEDFIKKIVQKDVNNYVEVPMDGGKPKVKGGQLVRGILTNGNIDFTTMGLPPWDNMTGGAFNINNNAVVVARAIRDYFVDGTPPEQTIEDCTSILDFQVIAKVGGKYSGVYQMVGDQAIPVQKVNRVYATADRSYGTLYKTHAVTGNPAKVAGLPTHCVVDNNNQLPIEVVDRKWYVKLAKKYINDFLGVKPPRKNTRRINSLKKKSLALFD